MLSQKDKMSTDIDQYLLENYDIYDTIGKGGLSTVYKAYDKINNTIVAIKRVNDVLGSNQDSQRLLREIRLLEHFSNHPNIIKLLNVMKSTIYKDVYMIYEYMEANLFNVIRANVLAEQHIKFITYQLLKAIKYIHSADIINRDLKPTHILINYECQIKIDDFKLAKSINTVDENDHIPDYIATRWYRAPEILLGAPMYGKPVDMWSLGCIVAEMINSKTLFPGTCTLNQLDLIIQVTGFPNKEDIDDIEGTLTGLLENIKLKNYKDFKCHFISASGNALDLLQKLLQFNPKKRITVEEALNHSYFNDLRCLEEESVYDSSINLEISEETKVEIQEYKQKFIKDKLKRQQTKV